MISRNCPLVYLLSSLSDKPFMKSIVRNSIILFQIIFIAFVVLFYGTIIVFSKYPESTDFAKYYMSAKYFWEGKSVYAPVPIGALDPSKLLFKSPSSRDTLHPNLNSPFQILLSLPLGFCDFRTAFWIWSVLSLCSGLAGVSIFAEHSSTRRCDVLSLLGFWILLLVYFPTLVTIYLGQLSLFLLLLLVTGWVACAKRTDRVAGVVFGIAMCLKIFMGLFLVLFFVRRRWQLLSWLFGTIIICNLIALPIFGIQAYKTHITILRDISWFAASWNASIMGVFTRIFGGSENIPLVDLPWLAYSLTATLSLSLVLCLIWLAWPRGEELSQDYFDLAFSLTIVAMLLISPLGWIYYFTLLVIPVTAVWQVAKKLRSPLWFKIMIVFAWLLSTIPHLLTKAQDVNVFSNWFEWIGFYVLIILTGILITLFHCLRKELQAQVS